MSGGWESLTLREEGGGWRHYLAGRPVHCGDGLQLQLPGGVLDVRYEAVWRDRQPDATLYLAVAVARDPATVNVPEYALFRWPRPDEHRGAATRCELCQRIRAANGDEIREAFGELLADIVRADATFYEHHQARRWDGRKPEDVDARSTIWRTPRELASGALRELGLPVPDPLAETLRPLAGGGGA